ncbi:hypothetical protein ACFXJO_05580 [Streptomyces lavendulae]|uniref:DUF7739 domain-containing protein n=1 Tax=Streptomyces lavendulae TaxID=1914 RepID=UPI0036B33074
MTWDISHNGSSGGYSYSYLAELGDKLSRAAGPVDGIRLAVIFGRKSGDPFRIQPAEAEQIGDSLHRTADKLRIWDRGWAKDARRIADSALLAAKLGEPWSWS